MATDTSGVSRIDGANTVYVRIILANGSAWDYETLKFEWVENGVLFEYHNTVSTTARVFVPFHRIDSVFQAV